MQEPFIRTHARKILHALLGLFVVAALLYLSPAREALASWRASSLLEHAQEYAEAGEWEEVSRSAKASMKLKGSLAAARLITEAALELNSPETFGMAYFLFQDPGATAADKVLALRLILDNENLKMAEELIPQLTSEDLRNREIHFQVVRGLVMNGQVAQAVQLVDDPEMAPRDPVLELMLVQGLVEVPTPGALEKGVDRLRRILEGDDREAALGALALLYAGPGTLRLESLVELAVERFKNDDGLMVTHQLQLDKLKIALGKVDRAETIKEAVRQYRESHLRELLAWLATLGEDERVVALSSSPAAREDAEMVKIRFRALENLEIWEVLQQELEEASVPYGKPRLLAMKSLVAHRLGERALSRSLWFQAMEAAKDDQKRNWFFDLAQIAGKMDQTDDRMEAVFAGLLHVLALIPEDKVLAELTEWLEANEDKDRLQAMSGRLHELLPDNPIVAKNHYVLKALHSEVEESDLETFQELVDRNAQVPLFRSSFSFILLRAGEPERALAQLEKITTAGGELNPTGLAVRAKSLEMLGLTEEAKEAAEAVDWENLDADQREHLELIVEQGS